MIVIREVPMSVLIKIFGISIVGVLAVGLLGCGCLFSSTPKRSPNLYTYLYEGRGLQYKGKYREALAKYEQASKKFPRFPDETKVIHVNFPTFLKYYIAFCYVKLAETEDDVSLHIKAEAAAKQCYQTAILPSDQADALYLWGYILFKQTRYEEARAKFEALLEILQQNESEGDFTADTFFALGKTYLELTDKFAAQRVFAQLEARIETLLPSYDRAEALYPLGKVYLELGDAVAAQRVFAKFEARVEADLREFGYHFHGIDFYEETLFGLGEVYLELGDEVAAQRVFGRLLVHFPDYVLQVGEVERLLEKQ